MRFAKAMERFFLCHLKVKRHFHLMWAEGCNWILHKFHPVFVSTISVNIKQIQVQPLIFCLSHLSLALYQMLSNTHQKYSIFLFLHDVSDLRIFDLLFPSVNHRQISFCITPEESLAIYFTLEDLYDRQVSRKQFSEYWCSLRILVKF